MNNTNTKSDTKFILGLSAFYHDSSACLVDNNGNMIAAAQQESFSRKKEATFPRDAIQFCLDIAGISLNEIDLIVYYEKPLLKFERLLETWLAFAPKEFSQVLKSAPVWSKEKLFLK